MLQISACRKVGIAVAVLFGLWTGAASAVPATLWYSGDISTNSGFPSYVNGSGGQSMVYEDFIVPAGHAWDVQEIWANVISGVVSDPADWQIRTGVSSGNGGTLVASGADVPDTFTSISTPAGEYMLSISGLNVELAPGTYWLGISGIVGGSSTIEDGYTAGANAIGPSDISDDAFVNSTTYSDNYKHLADNFSMGVAGSVPEPATLSLLGLGLTGLVAKLAKRRSR